MNNQKPLQIDDVLVGEFKVLDVFGGEGKSGMGIVYLVEEKHRSYPIVLKTFQKNSEISIQRFRAEAKTWISIGIHPNIVQAFFVREINEQLFIGAEYISPDENGRNTITDYLEQGSTSDYNVFKWAAQFCYAMEFAISKGLEVHRDIKPDNLMIDQFGNLKITDFGLAKAFYDYKLENKDSLIISNPNLTSEGSFLGTVLFASPEQILDSSSIDFRSDIYSFGIVLYQLISLGSFPYSLKGKTTKEEIAIMHLQEPIIEIQHPLFSIVEKCLAKSPIDRFQSFKELLLDLKKVTEKLKIKLPPNTIQEDDKFEELFRQSLSLLTLGEKEKALDLINEYLEHNIYDSSGWHLKGQILLEIGKPTLALKATLKSYDLDPNNSATLNNLGILYKRVGELDKAIAFLMEAIQIDNYNAGAAMNLAIALHEKGAFLGAADVILNVLNLTPDKKTLHFNAGNIAASAMKNGHFDKAIQILEILVNLVPEHSNYWFNLASAYQITNQKEKSIKCYKAVINKVSDDEESLISFSARDKTC